MAVLLPVPKATFADSNGNPLSGGKIHFYEAGTSTPKATYTDQSGETANANPVVLDAAGRADIWLASGSYKIVVKDSDDATLYTTDNVSAATLSVTTSTTAWTEHAVTNGQAAADLDGITVDSDDYSSVTYECEIIRGTTVVSNGTVAIQFVNGTARVVIGAFKSNESHGVTFTVSQDGTEAQLRAALNSGAGNGTIKLRPSYVPA